MIVDTSAVVAVVFQEPGYERLVEKLATSDTTGIGAPTVAECGAALGARLGADPTGLLDRFLAEFEIETVPFGDAHWREATRAYSRFGRGTGHPARLNVGDCLTYAVAGLAGGPLLFTGRDFTHTDLSPA